MNIKGPGAHLDHLVRQTRIHHVQLSSMADMKANMLLTMASVVIPLSVRYISEPQLKWATTVFISFCLLTIALATYAVMPKIPLSLKSKSRQDVQKSSFNLLFFGDFVQLDYEEFEAAMEDIMNDPSRTYQVQLQEVYTLGLFLAKKKYRFLRLAYITFIAGIFASALLVILSGTLG